MSIRFLFDENLDPRLKTALLRRDPAIEILRVGDPGALELGTLDPDILRFLEGAGYALVTNNRKSMPIHIGDHLVAGGHHWGIFLIRRNTPLGRVAEELYLIWFASTAEDWIDVEQRIPL